MCHKGAQYYVSDLPLEGHIAPYTRALHIISFGSCQVGRLSLPIIKKLYLNILLFTLLLFLWLKNEQHTVSSSSAESH